MENRIDVRIQNPSNYAESRTLGVNLDFLKSAPTFLKILKSALGNYALVPIFAVLFAE